MRIYNETPHTQAKKKKVAGKAGKETPTNK